MPNMGRDNEKVKKYNRSATESRLCARNRNSTECGNEYQNKPEGNCTVCYMVKVGIM